MVSPVKRQVRQLFSPGFAGERDSRQPSNPGDKMNTSIVSPMSSVGSPSTIAKITPTRLNLFDKRNPRERIMNWSGYPPPRESPSIPEGRQDTVDVEELQRSNHRKDKELLALQNRFNHIQLGLGSIDQERVTLTDKAKKLLEEKKHIQKQLELREKEISTLSRRCASQEEKMKEFSRLKSQNKELAAALDSVKNQLQDEAQDREELDSLRKKLQESELAREELQHRLRKVQREHDNIADTLQECLANIRKLTDEKQQTEDERRRERKRAELEMEKQRLAHVQAQNSLKEDLGRKMFKISQLEKILQDNMHTKNSLRREKALRQVETDEVLKEYTRKLEELQAQLASSSNGNDSKLNEEVDRLQEELNSKQALVDELREQLGSSNSEELEQTISRLRQTIKQKEAVMTGLENEFSGQMGELMKTQSSLDEAEEERKDLREKVQRLEKVECDYSALQEYVEILDSNLADLTTENAQLILERDNLQEEVDALLQKSSELEVQLSRAREHTSAREGDLRDLLEAEKEEIRVEMKTSLESAAQESTQLRTELLTRDNWVAKLESDLQEARNLSAQKDDAFAKLQKEKEEMSTTLQSSLAEAQEEAQRQETEVQLRDQQLEAIISALREDRIARQRTGSGNMLAEAQSLSEVNDNVGDHRDPPRSDDSTSSHDQKRTYLQTKIGETREKVSQMQVRLAKFDDIQDELLPSDSFEEERRELEIALLKANVELRTFEEQQSELLQRMSSFESGAPGQQVNNDAPDLSDVAKQMSDLEEELNSARDILNDKEKEMRGMAIEIEQLRNERDAARVKIASLEDSARSQKEVSDALLQEAHLSLQVQEKKAQDMEHQYAAILKIQTETDVNNKKAVARVASLEDQIVDMRARQAELEKLLKDSGETSAAREKEIEKLRDENKQSEGATSTLKEELNAMHLKLESLETNVQQLTAMKESLEMSLHESNESLSLRDAKVRELDEQLSAMGSTTNDLESSIMVKTKELKGLKSEIEELKEESVMLVNELEEALTALGEKETQVKELEADIAGKTSECGRLLEDLAVHEGTKRGLDDRLAAAELRVDELTMKCTSQESEINCMKSHSASDATLLEDLKQEKQQLESKYASLETSYIEATKSAEDRCQKLETQLESECKTVAEKQSQVEALEEEIKRMQSEKDDIDIKLSHATAEMAVRDQDIETKDARIRLLEQEVADLSKKENELAFVQSEEKRAEVEKLLEKAQVQLKELSTSLEESELRRLETIGKLEKANEDRASEEAKVLHHLQKCEELSNRVAHLEGLNESREAQLERAGTELNDALLEAKALKDQMQELNEQDNRLNELQKTVSKLETTVALRDDEIRELRVIELKDKEEMINELTEELNHLKEGKHHLEAELTSEMNELKRRNIALKTAVEESSACLESERQEAEKKLAEQDEMLQERHDRILKLTRQLEDFELQEQEWISSCEAIVQNESKMKEELERTKSALDYAISHGKEELEEQQRSLEAGRRQDVDVLSSRLRQSEEKIREMSFTLQERTGLLGGVVEHNKNLESRLDKNQARLSALEKELSRDRKELSETKAELMKTREELCNRENVLTAKLDEERTFRDVAEQSLAKLKVQCKDAEINKRLVVELEKDNAALKDKISRQEAYLQRKLQKEKVNRVLGGTPNSSSRSSVGSPSPLYEKATPQKVPAGTPAIPMPTSRLSTPSRLTTPSRQSMKHDTAMSTPRVVRGSGIPTTAARTPKVPTTQDLGS